MQDEKCQQKSKSISSADPNYFVHFAMRHPVVIETIKCKISDSTLRSCRVVSHPAPQIVGEDSQNGLGGYPEILPCQNDAFSAAYRSPI